MITVSLETAKKLKEAGFNKICFCKLMLSGNEGIYCSDRNKDERIFAPTVQEILEDLYDRGRKPLLWIYPNAGRRTVQLDEYGDVNKQSPQRNEENIAEGVAKYWLRCKENNHLT